MMGIEQDGKLVTVAGSVSTRRSDGAKQSELMVACAMGKLPVVKRLIAEGADPNCVNALGETPLTYAVAAGRQPVVRYLLARQADLELPPSPGWSPLMYAAATGNHRILAVLLAHGADVTRQDHEGRAANEIAKGAGHFRCAAVLDLRVMLVAARRRAAQDKPRPKRKAGAGSLAASPRRLGMTRVGTA